jgi:hypothetical protein
VCAVLTRRDAPLACPLTCLGEVLVTGAGPGAEFGYLLVWGRGLCSLASLPPLLPWPSLETRLGVEKLPRLLGLCIRVFSRIQ